MKEKRETYFAKLPPEHHSVDYLLKLISYEPDTGIIRWLRRPLELFPNKRSMSVWNAQYAGAIAGGMGTGYVRLVIDGHRYSGHNLAWYISTGAWPEELIDHRNLNGLDNRFCNLRQASKGQNQCNSKLRKDNKCGYKGVFLRKDTGRWHARITVRGRVILLGNFDQMEEAAAAYARAAAEHHGEFASAVDV